VTRTKNKKTVQRKMSSWVRDLVQNSALDEMLDNVKTGRIDFSMLNAFQIAELSPAKRQKLWTDIGLYFIEEMRESDFERLLRAEKQVSFPILLSKLCDSRDKTVDFKIRCIQLCIQYGADIHFNSDFIVVNAAYGCGEPALIEFLLDTCHCDANVENGHAVVAASQSYQNNDDAVQVVQMLVRRGANAHHDGDMAIVHAANNGNNALIVFLKEQCGLDVNAHRNKPLYFAAYQGHEETLSLLLKYGASPNTTVNNPFVAIILNTKPNAPLLLDILVQQGGLKFTRPKEVESFHAVFQRANGGFHRNLVAYEALKAHFEELETLGADEELGFMVKSAAKRSRNFFH
jgi:hypothetical protein